MKMKSLSVKSLSGAVLLGLTVLAASPSFAANPCAPTSNVKAMDANRDGKVTKDEYLAAMGATFDKAAGAKGYCTYEEIAEALNKLPRDFHW